MRAVWAALDVRSDPVGKLPKMIGYGTAMIEIASFGLNAELSVGTLLLTATACVLVALPTDRLAIAGTGFVILTVTNEFLAEPKATSIIVLAYVWLFAVAVQQSRRESLTAAICVGAALTLSHILAARLSVATLLVLTYALWAAVVTAVGSAIQSHRLYVASIEDRAVRAERTREEMALRRVAEERLRIARELHDVVAHHVAVVGMQVSLARTRLAGTHTDVDEVLAQAHESTKSVIREMQDILHVLREPESEQTTTAVPPTVVIGELHDLLRPFELLEHPPKLTVTGSPSDDVPVSVDLAVYRVLQEALTNAYKHGVGAADVRVEWGNDTDLTLTIRNKIAGSAGDKDSSGFGLLGMAERVRAGGGELRTEAREGVFTLSAVFHSRQDRPTT